MELPPEQADAVMFGPEWTFDADTQREARAAYAPVPAVELIAAAGWPGTLLEVAPEVPVPVQNVLAEFDSLWDSTLAGLSAFAPLFTAAPFVDVHLARRTGHSIDHHRPGSALHLRQLAFISECLIWSERD